MDNHDQQNMGLRIVILKASILFHHSSGNIIWCHLCQVDGLSAVGRDACVIDQLVWDALAGMSVAGRLE